MACSERKVMMIEHMRWVVESTMLDDLEEHATIPVSEKAREWVHDVSLMIIKGMAQAGYGFFNHELREFDQGF